MPSQYTSPILISPNEATNVLERVPLTASASEAAYDEEWLQDLMFQHPEALPIDEIDRSFSEPVPICKELNTPAGPIDCLFATPEGKLVVLEAKLWRNPEARRQVMGQILDYAKELSRWKYEDLQREVSRRTGRAGNALFDLVAERYSGIDEADFVDEVSRSLRQGRFLLLICGDGIREGVAAIADFIERQGTLHFTFGLVEMVVYRTPDGGLLVQPRVLAQTVIFRRTIVSLESDNLIVDEETEDDEEHKQLTDDELFYEDFWTELVGDLQLDDVSQPRPNITRQGTVYLRMPSGSTSWMALFFRRESRQVGILLTFNRGTMGDLLYERLLDERDAIEEESGIPINWESTGGKHSITVQTTFPDLRAPEHREEMKLWLSEHANLFVNVFRHRLVQIIEETS